MENWNLINSRKSEPIQESVELESLLGKYNAPRTPKKAPNCLETEQRDLISKLLNRPFKIVAGLTRGWTAQEMFELRKKAESFKANPSALMWKLIREQNAKIKKQLNK